MNNFKQDGFGLIEVIIVATIGVIVFLSSASCLNSFLGITMLNIDKTEALFLTKSSLEQARALRDEDWTNISGLVSGNLYYFESDGGSPEKWIAQAGTKSENKYIIWVVVSEVQRDGNDDLVESGGTVDSDTLKITAYVSWQTADGAKQIELYEYLTNFRN